MRLLVVMANYPYPPRTGSSIVAVNVIKFLSVNHEVDLLSLAPDAPRGEGDPLGCSGSAKLVFSKKTSWVSSRLKYLAFLFLGRPPSMSKYSSREMSAAVRLAVVSGKYDAVLLFEMIALQYFSVESFDKLVVNIEDPQSIRLFRIAKLDVWSLWEKLQTLILAGITAFYEAKALHKVARVILLSEADVQDMRSIGSFDNVVHMSYGVQQNDCSRIIGFSGRSKVILFSGSMYHPPNVDAAIFLIEKIFPLVLVSEPDARLQIVGAKPDVRIFKAAEKFGHRVEITGMVSSVADYIRCAAVSVCPVRLKIGVQTKILEALSWGTPVVTTSAGNSGVGGISGTHLWVEDDARIFADKICELLRGENWDRLSAEGRKLVAERFTWEKSISQLEECIFSVARNNI